MVEARTLRGTPIMTELNSQGALKARSRRPGRLLPVVTTMVKCPHPLTHADHHKGILWIVTVRYSL